MDVEPPGRISKRDAAKITRTLRGVVSKELLRNLHGLIALALEDAWHRGFEDAAVAVRLAKMGMRLPSAPK